jgi:hypothetical protein
VKRILFAALVIFELIVVMTVFPKAVQAEGLPASPISFIESPSIAMNQTSATAVTERTFTSEKADGILEEQSDCRDFFYLRNMCEIVNNYFEPNFN